MSKPRLNNTLRTPLEMPEHLRISEDVFTISATDLHRQASEWYEEIEEIEPAIQHALAGEAWTRAAYLIDQQADVYLSLDKNSMLMEWLGDLPDAELRTWPSLGITRAYLQLLEGDSEQAVILLEDMSARIYDQKANSTLHMPATDSIQTGLEELYGRLNAVRAVLALQTDRIELALELSRRALHQLPLARPFWRCQAAGSAGKTLLRSGQRSEACRYFSQARSEAELCESPSLILKTGLLQVDCLMELELMQVALQVCQELLSGLLEPEAELKHLIANLYNRWSHLLVETGRADEALAVALQSQLLAGDDSPARSDARLALARAQLARREFDLARRVLAAMTKIPEERYPGKLLELRIDVELTAERLEAALHLFTNAGIDPCGDLQAGSPGLQRLTARWLLAQSKAEIALERLEIVQQIDAGVDTMVLLALAFQALGEEQASLDALSQALFLAAPQSRMWPFLRYNRELARLLYKAAAQDIYPDFISRLLDRMLVE